MIKIHNTVIPCDQFPDGTLHISLNDTPFSKLNDTHKQHLRITWCYDNDAELFALEAIVNQLRENGATAITLVLPYIPHARMDRVHTGDVFTLKTFASIINRMKFDKVKCYEAHSNVSLALINNIENLTCKTMVDNVLKTMATKYNISIDDIVLFFPDEGAVKRYAGLFQLPYIFGMKNRDWSSGKIINLETIGDTTFIDNRHILIVDDISSRGGTFYYSAKALKEKNAASVSLFVTHCENTILQGDVIKTDLLDDIFTTDSIFTETNNELSNKITIVKNFR